jgi:hypothetical protein
MRSHINMPADFLSGNDEPALAENGCVPSWNSIVHRACERLFMEHTWPTAPPSAQSGPRTSVGRPGLVPAASTNSTYSWAT